MSSKTIKGLIFVVFVSISALVAVVVFYETSEDNNDFEVVEAENISWKESTTRESMTTKTSSNEPPIDDETTWYPTSVSMPSTTSESLVGNENDWYDWAECIQDACDVCFMNDG